MASSQDKFEETVFNTPKPQACSTSSKRSGSQLDLMSLDFPSYLLEDTEVMNRLREELAKTGLSITGSEASRESVTSSAPSSSLGILDDRDLNDFSVYGSTAKLLEAMQSGNTKENFQRDLVRERALQALNSTAPSISAGPSDVKEPRRSCFPLLSPATSFPKQDDKENVCNATFTKENQGDVSGFSILATSSQLDQDEKYCLEKWSDLPIEPRDVSFQSGISVGDRSLNFMPENDSFLQALGPANPPPFDRSDFCEDSRMSSVSVPSLCDIAEALRGVPTDASSSLLVDALLKAGSSARTSIATKSSVRSKRSSLSQSFMASPASGMDNVDSDSSGPEKPYRVTAVQGSAAQVIINTPSECILVTKRDDNEIILKLVRDSPDRMRLLLLPFVTGQMKIVVSEVAPKSLHHVIYLNTEEPNIELLSSRNLNIGNLPEGCLEKSVILLKNNNSAMICLNHFVHEENAIGERRFRVECSKEMVLPPNGVLGADIFFHGALSGSRLQEVAKGEVEFFMNVPLDSSFPRITVAKLQLTMNVFKPRIQVGKSCLGQVYPPGEKRNVEIINLSTCPLQLSASVDPPGLFGVSPTTLTLQPKNPCIFSVIRKNDGNSTVVGSLCLHVNPQGPVYSVKLVGAAKDTDASKYAFPLPDSVYTSPSRSISPSSVGQVDGPLHLESTQGILVWSSVDLNTSVEMTCCLRNKSPNREKLIFNLRDPTGSFYILKDGEKRKEMKMSLDPMQKKEITVTCRPSAAGQLKAAIDITRVFQDGEKKVLGLLAFGGRGKIIVDGLSVDLDTERRTLLLDGDTLSSTFFLQNVGSGVSYFSITQPCIEGTCMDIEPRYGLLDPGTREVISLQYQSSSTQIEYLLKSNKKSTLKVTNIVITYGDQPSRLRLHRLLKNHGKKTSDPKLTPIFKNLREMESAFPIHPGSNSIVSSLKDPLSSLCTLYREGVLEWNVDVVVNRTALEAAQLDSTDMFTPLDTTLRANETTALGLSTTYCDISSFGAFRRN